MDPVFLLHAGRHKTGTSALQRFFAANDRVLLGHGILYPRSGRSGIGHHHDVFAASVATKSPIDGAILDAILAEAAGAGAGRILLSSEMLSRPGLTADYLATVRDSFPAGPGRLRVILYFRKQDDFLKSTYAELVKRGKLAAPRTIHDTAKGLDYAAFAEKYRGVFGAENLVVRDYDRAARTDLFDDALAVLGIPGSAGFRRPSVPANQRLPWRYLALLRHANRRPWQRNLLVHDRTQKAVRFLGRRFPGFMETPEPLTAAESAALLEQYRASNDTFRAQYLTDA